MADFSKIKKRFKDVLNLYHFFNMGFTLTFVLSKNISFINVFLYDENHREITWVFFLFLSLKNF